MIDTPKRVKGKMVQVFLNRMLGMEIHDQALLCASIALPGHTEPVSWCTPVAHFLMLWQQPACAAVFETALQHLPFTRENPDV